MYMRVNRKCSTKRECKIESTETKYRYQSGYRNTQKERRRTDKRGRRCATANRYFVGGKSVKRDMRERERASF
ncbi:unnamed protein product [Ilex paraguariensis]|uniref:Uncharacterized protein n=1 Tax=Ilex paraguariensis TaxID=185542 RepID=A0ABC8RUS9_9AQUA